MKKIVFLLILSWACMAIPAAKAADAAPEQKDKPPATSKESFYKISIGDTLDIQVYQEADLSGAFEVKEDGTISYPLLGSVKVEGLTIPEVEKTLTELLDADYLVAPFVQIQIKKYKKLSGTILVFGSVPKPGAYTLPADKAIGLLDAVSLAGGFTASASADETTVTRATSKGQKSTLAAQASKILSGETPDIELQSGDVINVPELLKMRVTILGSVQRPGTYTAPDYRPLTLSQAVSLAGGFTNVASIKKVRIIRDGPEGKKETLNPKMKDILSGKKADVELKADDLITVPERLF